MTVLTLDYKGVAVAAVLGLIFLALDGFNLTFILFMLYFLVLSAIVTSVGKRYKKKLGVYERSRGILNVLSNSGGPLMMAGIFYVAFVTSHFVIVQLALVGFAASVASITADKFSSEIGVLNGAPRVIFTMKKVKKGVSGAITALGSTAGLVAAFLIGIPFTLITTHTSGPNSLYIFNYLDVVISVTLGGFAGTLIDSMAGYFEERGFGNKFTSNFVCGVFGGIIGLLIFLVLV